ncbi:MAG: hypothetical protein IJ571_06040 [Ruminococcus sp.]|nr:hypothetical protein [Ruminococcus sp.]
MNFLVLGTPFLLFMLNYDWPLSYAIKLVGAVFIIIGLAELRSQLKYEAKLKTLFVVFAFLCGFSAVLVQILRLLSVLGEMSKTVPLVADIIALLLWAAAVLIPLYAISMLYDVLDKNREYLAYTANLVKLEYTLKKICFVTIFVYISNVIYVLLPYRQTGDFFGVLMAIGKIILYILIIIASIRFFKVRSDYYQKAEDSEE